MKALKATHGEAFNEILSTALKKIDPVNLDAIAALVAGGLVDKPDPSAEPPVVFNNVMDLNAEMAFQSAYPEFRFVYSKSAGAHPHARAANARVFEYKLAERLLGADKIKHARSTDAVVIKDVGGSINRIYANDLVGRVHACTPMECAKDGMRRSAEAVMIERLKRSKDYINHSDEMVKRLISCQRLSQHCTVRAEVILAMHCMYDMTGSTLDIANCMSAAGAKLGMITMLWDELMLINDDGYFEDLDIHWSIDRSKNTIAFWFGGQDSSHIYEHNLGSYMKTFFTGAAYSNDGTLYYFETVDSRMGVKFIKVVLAQCQTKGEAEIKIPVRFGALKSHTALRWYKTTYTGMKKKPRVFTEITLFVPTSLFEKAYSFSLTLSPVRFSSGAIFEFLRSANTRLVVNGVSVENTRIMKSDELYSLAHALFCIAFCKRYEEGTLTKAVTDEINAWRTANQSLLSASAAYVWNKTKNFFSMQGILYGKTPYNLSGAHVVSDQMSKEIRDIAKNIDMSKFDEVHKEGWLVKFLDDWFALVSRKKAFEVEVLDLASIIPVTTVVPRMILSNIIAAYPKKTFTVSGVESQKFCRPNMGDSTEDMDTAETYTVDGTLFGRTEAVESVKQGKKW